MKTSFLHRIFRFRLQKIRNRFLVVMIVLSIPPLFILGFVSYNIAKDTLKQNNIRTNEESLQASSEVADLLLQNIINLNRSILADSELRQELRDSGDNLETESMMIGVNTANRLQTVVVSNFINTKYIDSICLFDRNFRSVCTGSGYTGLYDSEERRKEITSTDWYAKSVEAKGKEVFFGYNVLDQTQDNETFSSVKILKDPAHVNVQLGLLIINIKKSMFSTVFNKSENSRYAIIAPSSNWINVVYDNRPASSEEMGPADNLLSIVKKFQESGYLVTRYKNQLTGWTFLYVVKVKELLKQSNQIGLATSLIALFIAFIALLLSYILSGTITRPLLKLKKMMAMWAKGRRNFNETFDIDEVGIIGETFKRIVRENNELNERLMQASLKEKEAELRALQAQIKPHFLYNTLDSIYWMAVMHNNQDIAQIAVSLSESFKLSLNKGKETILVFKELQHIEHYMTIQNIRYNNRFSYIQDVEQTLMGMEILKLLLQPLVENAIYHGLEPKMGEGTIRLTGRIASGYIYFTVEDDGVGIEHMDVVEQGYGLKNVRERLQLYYGAKSSFNMQSERNKGTVVELRFPKNMRKEE